MRVLTAFLLDLEAAVSPANLVGEFGRSLQSETADRPGHSPFRRTEK
jgi:hypothetical protein